MTTPCPTCSTLTLRPCWRRAGWRFHLGIGGPHEPRVVRHAPRLARGCEEGRGAPGYGRNAGCGGVPGDRAQALRGVCQVTFDLLDPEMAYFFGFVQADGHLRKGKGGKGSFAVELTYGDRDLLVRFATLVDSYSSIRERTRSTNFKADVHSATWSVFAAPFRDELHRLGVPYGDKSTLVAPPKVPFSAPHYFRGLLDANGSVGVTSMGLPFVSWCTASTEMAQGVAAFITSITGQCKLTNRNKRDAVYNIAVFKEDAQVLIRALYPDGCLCLERKRLSAGMALAWERPEGMRRNGARRKWTKEEDAVVLTAPSIVAAERLQRTVKAVNLRKHRLLRAESSRLEGT